MNTELPILQDQVEEREPTIQVNERFGPTTQGEGIDIGKSCYFIRLQGCPVKCESCDTAYTWNRTEEGEKTTITNLEEWAVNAFTENPGCGLVLSGGEPLLHYKNDYFRAMLQRMRKYAAWVSIETSGYVGNRYNVDKMVQFLHVFDTIHLSPKITPCLHGKQSDQDALHTQQEVFARIPASCLHPRLVYKFVARDDNDVEAVLRWDNFWRWRNRGYPIYLMPYGIHREEIIETCIRLLPACAKHGFILSPRLHSILWGPQRGV